VTAVRTSRKLVAFRLGKLIDAATQRRRPDHNSQLRPGPGWPNVYPPATDEWQVGIPERRYALLAKVFTRAVLTDSLASTCGWPAWISWR
jgi:hypothetical protein